MLSKKRLVIPVALTLAVLSVVVGLGCSSKSSPTQPGGGGGGGTESFNSGNFSSGSFVHTFSTAGDYGYYCQIHGTPTSGMHASVHVGTGATDSVTVNIGNNFFAPNPVNVNPGGYVRWISGGSLHSVTR